MHSPRIAVISFPGNNCEVESIRAIKTAGMEPLFFKWNDSREMLKDVDGYFLVGGFSYEDRGRAGMVAARDPLFAFLHEESAQGKVIIGNCNGAQVLIESGLVPLDHGLKMSLARNVIDGEAVGFINEWVWITPSCERERCATSDWSGAMHLPIAHGEGRYVTKDRDVWQHLKEHDQMAFSYCNADAQVSNDPVTTPNGSTFAIAGLCNPAGNVVALMPHPERTINGDAYFSSMKRWIERGITQSEPTASSTSAEHWNIATRAPCALEIFISTIITNNEERTVEQATHRILPELDLTQMKYLAPAKASAESILSHFSIFNPNKEKAMIRKDGKFYKWDNDAKCMEQTESSPLQGGVALLRRDEPDTGAATLGEGSQTGVCYVVRGADEKDVLQQSILEIFGNPHASTIERLQ